MAKFQQGDFVGYHLGDMPTMFRAEVTRNSYRTCGDPMCAAPAYECVSERGGPLELCETVLIALDSEGRRSQEGRCEKHVRENIGNGSLGVCVVCGAAWDGDK